MKSLFFSTDEYKKVEEKIKNFLNSQSDFLSTRTASSTRAVGDAIQDLLAENFKSIIGDKIKNYSSVFARRAMADIAFFDINDCYYVIDVKTHRLDTVFNMPNLTSVERLARFYEDDKNNFVVLMVAYNIKDVHIKVEKVHFAPIEFLSWDCLTIGALGWGQIQIANSNKIDVIPQNSRKKWMIKLCNNLFEFYPNEIEKIKIRIEYFKKVKKYWLAKKG
ncbi:MAG: hypothetical protein CVU80_00685 [Elusimicrobia bacterium HGW-Elusimicrobia-4]|nr:MAG: hypothetical protein CVU80_00685 [Elusimicrobia bacterium HGW-Elusimicrobia-4]